MNHKGLKILVCSLALLTFATGCSFGGKDNKKNDDKKKPSQNSTVIKDEEVEGLKVTGLNITFKDGISTVVASVTNKTESDMALKTITIELKDKKDKVIVETLGNIGDSIKAGETKSFTSFITMDVRNAVKAEYKISK